MGTSSNHHCWVAGSSDMLEYRDVLRCVLFNHVDNFILISVLASPYLLSLGLSKSIMAVVFLAGPISGLVMQPLIGNWHMYLSLKTGPDSTPRCIGGQLHFKFRPPKTLHVTRNTHLRIRNASTGVHETSSFHIHGIGWSFCWSHSSSKPFHVLNTFVRTMSLLYGSLS
jgi:hypothetical protein